MIYSSRYYIMDSLNIASFLSLCSLPTFAKRKVHETSNGQKNAVNGIILFVDYQDMFDYKRFYKSNNNSNVRLCQVE